MKTTFALRSSFTVIAACLSLMGLTETANAAGGVVSGTFFFWNRNGSFCPAGNACVGSIYTEAAFDHELPVSNATIWIEDDAGAMIGSGVTDDGGAYSATWTATALPKKLRVVVLTIQRENRFFLANEAGQYANAVSDLFDPQDGTSAGSPQVVGDLTIGSSLAPDDFFNAYWAAEFEWRTVFSLVGALTDGLTGVEMRGFADNMPGFMGTQLTSAASGPANHIQFDANAAFDPQARAMHEYGHIASYVTHPFDATGAYDWMPAAVPPAPQSGTWRLDSPEWASVAFEEAFATHYGSIAFWNDNADTPTTCNSGNGNTCYTTTSPIVPNPSTDIEASSVSPFGDTCDTTPASLESRRAVSAMRYLWDVYDNRVDNLADNYSANAGDFWRHLAVLANYPDGTGPNQIDEAWDDARALITEPDGRGSLAYHDNYMTLTSVDTAPQRAMNCTPP